MFVLSSLCAVDPWEEDDVKATGELLVLNNVFKFFIAKAC